MKKFGLKPLLRRGQRPQRPGDHGQPETGVANVLKVLCPLEPNVVWAGDFTYLWFQERFWYVATVIDVHSREIVGWHVASHRTTSLIVDAFLDAVRRTGTASQYFHSDQERARRLEEVCSVFELLLPLGFVKFCLRGRDW